MSDEAIRVAGGFRLGAATCQPHTCLCGLMVDAKGLHGLSCRKSAPRQIRHAQMNDFVGRAVKKAQYPTVKEPAGLARTDGKRPDGATLNPCTRGKPLGIKHDASFHSDCNRNGRWMEPTSYRICQRARKKDD